MLSPEMVADWYKDAAVCSAGRIETRLMKACQEIHRLQKANAFAHSKLATLKARIWKLTVALRRAKDGAP